MNFFGKTMSLNLARLNSLQKVYDFLTQDFSFPGNFLHVIGIWNGMIIDYKCQYCLPLTNGNLKKICGYATDFFQVVRGCAIFPSKSMKKAIGRTGDWGESMVYATENDSLQSMFVFQKKSRRNL